MKHLAGTSFLCLAAAVSFAAPAVAQERPPAGARPGASAFTPVLFAQAGKPWEKFSPPGAGFTVLLPGRPSHEEQVAQTRIGRIINHVYALEAGGVVYMMSYADFPEPVTDPQTIKAMLDGARDNALAKTGGRLKEEKEIKLDGRMGRDWFVGIPGGLARARAYWDTQRLYQLIVLMREGKDAAAEKRREATMRKFLESFALTGASQ
jgi:hypothetical protein